MYNGIPIVSGVTIVGYADDTEVIVLTKHLEDVELSSSVTITKWLKDIGIALAVN